MALPAKPVKFIKCFMADSSPGHVEPVSEAALASSPCIAVELEDHELAVSEVVRDDPSLLFNLSREELAKKAKGKGLVRYMFHPHEARQLCAFLIQTLSTTADPLAKELQEVIDRKYEEGKEEEDDDHGSY